MGVGGLGPITQEDVRKQEERDEFWRKKREEGTIGTETLDSALSMANSLRKQIFNPEENENARRVSQGLQTAGKIFAESYQDTREFGEWYDIKQNIPALGLRGIEATGAVVSNVVGKPVAGVARQFGFDPRIAGSIALAAELAATAGVAKGASVAKRVAGDTIEGLAYGIGGTGGAGAMRGTGKVLSKVDDLYTIHDQIRAIDKAKLVAKGTEKTRIKNLIESGELKPPPSYKLKTSADAAKYYGLTSPELKAKYDLRYNQYGSSSSGDFKLKSLKLNKFETDKRDLMIRNVTESDEINRLGKKKWDSINTKLGMEAHHIVPINVSNRLKDLYLYTRAGVRRPNGQKLWLARVKRDALDGIYHGNHRRNIVAVRGSTKEPLTTAGKTSEIYHRKGKPEFDNPGYHSIEKAIKWETEVPDEIDLTPYRDIMWKQVELRHKADKIIMDTQGKPRQITKAPKQ